MTMKLPMLLEHVQSLGHKVFTTGLYNLNLVGVRTRDGVADAFDDWMVVIYQDEAGWVERWWPITTDPGLYYLANKEKWYGPAGVAILVPGQYRNVYKIDLHGRTKYEALCQRNGAVRIYRDGDLDNVLDYDEATIKSGTGIGINIHASTMSPYEGDTTTQKVGAWSAGCQVFQNESDFRAFMGTCKKQIEHHPTWTTFTYTLILEQEG
jgi:hypothetical protein